MGRQADENVVDRCGGEVRPVEAGRQVGFDFEHGVEECFPEWLLLAGAVVQRKACVLRLRLQEAVRRAAGGIEVPDGDEGAVLVVGLGP
eukprot:367083-Pyramimonas_sp.AAC.1